MQDSKYTAPNIMTTIYRKGCMLISIACKLKYYDVLQKQNIRLDSLKIAHFFSDSIPCLIINITTIAHLINSTNNNSAHQLSYCCNFVPICLRNYDVVYKCYCCYFPLKYGTNLIIIINIIQPMIVKWPTVAVVLHVCCVNQQ